MSRTSRVRHSSNSHPASIERSHTQPGHIDAISDWHRIRHVAASQATVLLAVEDPVFAECAAITATMAHLVPTAEALGVLPAGQHERALIDDYVPRLADDGMLVMLLALASVHHGAVRQVATAAADRLIGTGATVPEWAQGLRDPITVGECLTVIDAESGLLELICTLGQSGYSSAVRIQVNEHRCGAALGVHIGIEGRLPALLKARQRVDAHLGRTSRISSVGPAEFRGLAEAALDARAAHDRDHSLGALHEMAFEADPTNLEPGYLLLAALLRSRLQIFPAPAAPPPPHRPGQQCSAAIKT